MKDGSAVAFSLINQLKDLLKQQGFLFLETGKLLKIIRDEKHYKSLGYEEWLEFVASDEIGISKSTVYSYIGIYELFILKFGIEYEDLAGIPWDKLSLALGAAKKVEDKDDMLELIEKVKTLSRSDLQVELSDNENAKKENPKTRVIKVFKHEKCGKWLVDMELKDVCRCEFVESLIKVRDLVVKNKNDEAIGILDRLISV